MNVRSLVIMLTLALALPAGAHHSLAVYDSEKPVTITGTVTKVELRNPHAWVTLSLKNEDGALVTQRIEMAGATSLMQRRFDKSLLAIGSTVTFEAWLPKNPNSEGAPSGRTITLPDGRRFDVADKWGLAAWTIEPQTK